MTQQAYPLAWPPGFPRTKDREKSKFKTTLASALGNVRRSLELFGKDSRKPIAALVISSNYSLGDERPADPGVAVYFQWEGLNVCIPVDRYATLADNLQAIHHIIEARRVELRHGSLQLIRATFTGFGDRADPGEPGSLRHLCDAFMASDEFAALDAAGTQKMYRRNLLKVCSLRTKDGKDAYGEWIAEQMKPIHVEAISHQLRKYPTVADNCAKALRIMFNWARKHERFSGDKGVLTADLRQRSSVCPTVVPPLG